LETSLIWVSCDMAVKKNRVERVLNFPLSRLGEAVGKQPRQGATARGIELQLVKLAEAKKGFVLLPKGWVVQRSFAWAARFMRLAKDYERLPDVLRGLHFLIFAILLLRKAIPLLMAAANS
jgi:transposase